jgi:3-carboxy-cis,cis-muconate cycloisomerase
LTSTESPAFADFGLLDPLAQGSRSGELVGDVAWLAAMVDVEVAVVRSLVAAGFVPEWMDGVADSLVDRGGLDPAAVAAAGRGGGNPVIPLVKQLGALAEKQHAGAADHIHVGATSQDILDSAAMLVARRAIDEIAVQLATLEAALVLLVVAHRATPMAGRTLGQHASPTSFGLVAATWLDGIASARARLAVVRDALPVQFGGSVGTLVVLADIARQKGSAADPESIVTDLATRLELRSPAAPWHTNRLPIVELGSALAAVIGAIGSFALDVTVLSRTEIAEVSERLGSGEGGSSAMPHKRNPVTSTLLVSAARRAPGRIATLFDAQLAEDQRPSGAWHSEWSDLRELLKLAIDASTAGASLGGRLEVDAERMRGNLEFTDGLVYSERASTILGASIGKTEAFRLVSDASTESAQTHRPLRVVLSALLAGGDYDDATRASVWDAFDPDASLGASSAIIDRVLRHVKELS